MVWRRLTVPVACGLGPLIIIAAVLRNWHGWAPAVFWLDDIVAGLFVIGAAIFAYAEQDSLRGRLLTGSLAMAAAVVWGSLFEAMAGLHPEPETWSAAPMVALTLTVVALLVAAFGLAVSLPSKRRPLQGTRPEKQKTRR
jgi:peptidoglycan/LPS O-acetylase OafA/YrhL